MKEKDKDLSVVAVTPENADTTTIVFKGPGMERFKDRKAGQFASIRVLRDGVWSEPHPFTLSCSPEEDALRMTIKKSGTFTSSIPEIPPGTPVQCAGPYGQFCKDIDTKPRIVMIAGGVGITPFLSVLRHFREIKATNEVLLFWSNKTPGDAFAAEELAALAGELPLRVVHVFTRTRPQDFAAPADAGSVTYEFGRMDHDMIMRHMRTTDAAFYVCGPPPMQEAVLNILQECGVDPATVQKEAFVFSKPPAP